MMLLLVGEERSWGGREVIFWEGEAGSKERGYASLLLKRRLVVFRDGTELVYGH